MKAQAVQPTNNDHNASTKSRKPDSWVGNIVIYVGLFLIVICIIVAILTLLGPTIGNTFSTISPGI